MEGFHLKNKNFGPNLAKNVDEFSNFCRHDSVSKQVQYTECGCGQELNVSHKMMLDKV
jgi:hypothetical protein